MRLTAETFTQIIIILSSLAVGYHLGAKSGLSTATFKSTEEDRPADTADIESEDEEELADEDLSSVQAGAFEQCKLVLLVRTDLKMSSGKISAQCSHATLACYKALVAKNPQLVRHWERTGQAKIALRVNSENELLELEAMAKIHNLCARSIQDAGRTQVTEGSLTVLGIGPAPVKLINEVTGHLKLL
ncbi:PTH2-domain-containing protein [Rickenella mellea]|uniref:peptidyl-tRNA hydrolase n=1 Tax=Rickenella mellea TaxID=50990 RepID=A0A4Y7QPL5_9AGAM|nr:PTH2-domain-containing protein [Rickenella mellea]